MFCNHDRIYEFFATYLLSELPQYLQDIVREIDQNFKARESMTPLAYRNLWK